MQPYLKAFTVISIAFLFQGCVAAYKGASLARDEGMESFYSNYAQCVNDMDSTYSKFPIDRKWAYVFKESGYIEKIKGKTSTTVKPDPVLGPFLPVVEKKKAPDREIRHWKMQCVMENVDLNHNKRLLEVQRCVENRCMASFNEEDWWPDDRMQSNDGFAGPWSESWAISKLEICASCRFSEAKLLAEGGHDSNFVARKLDGFKRPNRLSSSLNSRSDSPFTEYDYRPVLDTVGYIRGYTPIHMFDSARESYLSRLEYLMSISAPLIGYNFKPEVITSRVHLREIIFCDPNYDGTFYITDTPVVLASD